MPSWIRGQGESGRSHSRGRREEQGLRGPGDQFAALNDPFLPSLLVHDLQSFGLDNVSTRGTPWGLEVGRLAKAFISSNQGCT